jgi:ABC-type oligopeptide transport system substrate-binding subunit
VHVLLGASALQPFNLFEAGAIDTVSVTSSNLDRVLAPESGLSGQVVSAPLFNFDYIAFRTDVEPFNDPKIREALALAFPKDNIALVSNEGYVSTATGVIPNGMLGRDWPVEASSYDLEAAKKAITESSYGSAEKVPPIRIYVSGYFGAEVLRDTVGESLGLTIEVIDVEWTEFVSGLSNHEYDAFELYWGADYPDPESILLSLFGTGQPDNYAQYNNPAFDLALGSAASEPDVEKRAEYYLEAAQMLADDHVVIPLYYDVAYQLTSPAVKGLNLTAMGLIGLESVWMEH